MSIRILLVDDQTILRDGLRSLLEKQPDFDVVAEAENGRTAIQKACELMPNVVIMDVAMPDLNGIEATRQIRKELPNARVIALTVHSDKNYLRGMLRAGASGYLLKDCAAAELVNAVRVVASGKAYVSPEIANQVIGDYCNAEPGPATLTRLQSTELTPKEREILQLIAEGISTKEIANRLKLSIKTVERSRAQIMEKLELYSVAELTKYAVRQGLTPLE